MTRFLHWRKMTWAIVVWGVAMGAWVINGAPVAMNVLLWSAGMVILSLTWFLSRPLWRQGHGARLRPLQSTRSRAVRSFEKLSTGH
jgi:hypothetical protein